MSTPHPSALDLAISHAADRHLASEKELAQARKRLRSAENTYSTLDNFRGEYACKLRGVKQLNTDTLGNYHRFLGKLSLALQSQQQDVTQAGQALQQQQKDWSESLRKLKAMELLRNRRAVAAQSHVKRQEQKQSDEFATRGARRGRSHS